MMELLVLEGASHIYMQFRLHGPISSVRRIKPIDVMALFLSLAYISISLDATGLLRFLAFWVLKKGGSRGRRLYFLLYTFFFVSGLIFGNVRNQGFV